MATSAIHIDPAGIYDDVRLYDALEVSAAILGRARRDGRLRYTRQGRRILYLGRWVLDWLERSAEPEVANA
jgi:hypothetical protein